MQDMSEKPLVKEIIIPTKKDRRKKTLDASDAVRMTACPVGGEQRQSSVVAKKKISLRLGRNFEAFLIHFTDAQ